MIDTPGPRIEVEKEEDGHYLAEVPSIPGAMVYGATADDAIRKAESLVLLVGGESRFAPSSRKHPRCPQNCRGFNEDAADFASVDGHWLVDPAGDRRFAQGFEEEWMA